MLVSNCISLLATCCFNFLFSSFNNRGIFDSNPLTAFSYISILSAKIASKTDKGSPDISTASSLELPNGKTLPISNTTPICLSSLMFSGIERSLQASLNMFLAFSKYIGSIGNSSDIFDISNVP
eukprot:NODE_616_length_5966_cov_0.249531.p3 type:complete len:124 gc:universal NODE_616_length_5966_cov_0.249531:2113-2484(+)